ncbi:MAG: hypothetical protein IKQ90_04365, partial [Ruminococcus sp.]|nr:hypothetical protein [Ruminococcus sp.]
RRQSLPERPVRGNLTLKVLGREFEGEPFFKRVSLNNRHKLLYEYRAYRAEAWPQSRKITMD